jgi:molybdenum-dependent DNA-binding transcriptional regulator ModE
VFEDKRTSFLVKFYQVMPAELSEEEQKILAYVKEHGSIRRSEAQKLLEVSDRRAKYILEMMENAKGSCAKRDDRRARVICFSKIWTIYGQRILVHKTLISSWPWWHTDWGISSSSR